MTRASKKIWNKKCVKVYTCKGGARLAGTCTKNCDTNVLNDPTVTLGTTRKTCITQ